MFRKLFYNESGQDMVEYALLASFISVVAIGTLRLIGPLVSGIYQNVADSLS
jgi:Flp pilus assembly pilin Flp